MAEYIKRDIGQDVRLVRESENRFRVLTPFVLDDGDHLAIVLKREGGAWLLTDEGHALMRLSFRLSEDTEQPMVQQVIAEAVAKFGGENRDGELILRVTEDRYENAVLPFAQMLLRIEEIGNQANSRSG